MLDRMATPTESRMDIPPYPRLQRALNYWESKRGRRRMPARRDLDPLEIPELLPFVILTDVTHDPLDLRYRLIGTAVVDRCARDYTGLRLRALPGKGPGSVVWDLRAKAVQEGRPVSREDAPYVGPSKEAGRVRDLHLPLSNDGERVNMLFTVTAFDEVRAPSTRWTLSSWPGRHAVA